MITVRPARPDEYDGVEKFYRDLIRDMRGSEFKPEWEMGVYPTEQFLRGAIKESSLFLAHAGERLAGVMILNHDCAPEYENAKWRIAAKKDEVMIVHALGVSAPYQGQGIGGQIVARVVEMCKQGGIKAIRLDVLKKNIPAAKLYLSMGFQHVASVKMYYEDTGLTDFELYELAIRP